MGRPRKDTGGLFESCRQRLEERKLWDPLSERELREALALIEDADGYRTECARALKLGDARRARVLLTMRRDALAAADRILAQWDLVPRPKRGRPAEETPEDLRAEEEDDGWDDFGQ